MGNDIEKREKLAAERRARSALNELLIRNARKSPEQIEAVRAAKRAEAIDNTPLGVDQLLPSLPFSTPDKVTSE